MATWRGYIAGQDVNLNASQRILVWQAVRALGANQQGEIRPNFINHKRFSLDESKIIAEADFDQDELSIANFKQILGDIFGIDPATIDHTTQFQTFDALPTRIVTFSRNSTSYFRLSVFGDITSTWQKSHIEVLAYLAANLDEWQE